MSVAINKTADRVAKAIRDAGASASTFDRESVRDLCDIATGGDLDCVPLDLLTDAVLVRLEARS
jgi:hypothetical protein